MVVIEGFQPEAKTSSFIKRVQNGKEEKKKTTVHINTLIALRSSTNCIFFLSHYSPSLWYADNMDHPSYRRNNRDLVQLP